MVLYLKLSLAVMLNEKLG